MMSERSQTARGPLQAHVSRAHDTLDAARLTSCGRSDSRASARATSCEDGDHRIGQGRANAKTFLTENVEIAAEIKHKILTNHGLIADAMLDGPGDQDGEDS